MDPLPVLTRPDKGQRLPLWPFAVAGAVFFILLGVGNFFIDRSLTTESEIPNRRTTPPIEVALQGDPAMNAAADLPAGWSIYFDPTLMVLPNERSYSKSYLARRPDWQMPSFDLSVHRPPYEFRRPYFRVLNAAAPARAAGWSKTNPAVIPFEAGETPFPASTSSSVALFGELHGRPILLLPEFPRVAHKDLLMPTELSIRVDASGAVRMAMIDQSSGDDKIDELALRLAREISFLPAAQPSDALEWGVLKIRWVVDLKPARH